MGDEFPLSIGGTTTCSFHRIVFTLNLLHLHHTFFVKLAFPHVHCGDSGDVHGFPFWSGDSSHGHVAGRMTAIAAASFSNTNTAAAMTTNATPTTPNNSRGRKKKKIIPTAHLPNEEREELHIEMYKYFQWLHTSLATAVAAGEQPPQQAPVASSDKKKRRSVSSAAGVNLSALQNLMESMESTFKVVRNAQPAIAAASATAAASTLPFLEEVLGEPLGKLVDVVRKDPEAKSARTKRSRGLAFEDMYERLLQFNQVCLLYYWCNSVCVVSLSLAKPLLWNSNTTRSMATSMWRKSIRKMASSAVGWPTSDRRGSKWPRRERSLSLTFP